MRNQKMRNLPPKMRLAVARALAKEAMPYFALGLNSLVPYEMPGLGTMGVTKGNVLLVDYEFLADLTGEEAATVVIHEYMHRYFKHAERFEELVKRGVLKDNAADRKLSNIAADCEINDNLLEAKLPLPGEPCLPSTFDLPNHLSFEEYVLELLKIRSQVDSFPGALMSGQCGSGAGNPHPQEPTPQSDPEIQEIERSEVDQHVINTNVHEQISKAANGHGTVPSGLARYAKKQLEPSKVPWQQKLMRSARNSVAFRAGAVDFTFQRPSRRQHAMAGFNPMPILPGMHAPLCEVAFVFDTSGSMGNDELQKLINEVAGVLKALPGSRITMLACDAAVHSIEKIRSIKEVRKHLKGGGGTDFIPAFQAIEKLKPKPDLIVFGTDGYGTYPAEPPRGAHVIWLNVGGHINVSWGEVIEIDQEEL